MTKKQLERWEKKRAKGKSEFILKDGGVIFGLLGMGLILALVKIVIGFVSSNFTFDFFDKSFQVGLFVGVIIAFPIGCLFGWVNWEVSEWSYSRAKRKSE
jgi:uncharacterized integral membrane protein